jgi:pyruvate dehydrogenase E1 component alpha subunit
MRGHAAHDNQSYVAKELLEQWRKRDPIAHLERELLGKKTATQAEIDGVNRKVEQLLDEELAWTEGQPPPAPEEAVGGVYAGDDGKSAVAGVGREPKE